jgi:hypothetical protein
MAWLEIVGWVGSALLVWSLLQTRVLRLRVINLVGCLVLIVYNGINQIWPMLGLNIVLAGINTWQIRKLISTRHDDATYEVVEVEADGELLLRMLDRHRGDILHFNPGIDLTGPEGERIAFLVVSGDAIAGVVVVRDAGNGVAQVVLDYVTPKYRDFEPGEFVFRRSGVFAEHGFTKIMTPPGMVNPYYTRVGFEPAGSSYALAVQAADDH